MKLNPIILAVRAISTEFATRMYLPVVLIIGGGAIAVIAVLIWLVTISAWWWIALAPVILATITFAIAAVITGLLLSLLKPRQTHDQRTKVKRFVDALQESSEAIQTPKFIILFRLVKDIVAPTGKGYVKELASNASTLRTGFQTIVASFNQ